MSEHRTRPRTLLEESLPELELRFTIELAHPTLSNVVLVLRVFDDCAEVDWQLAGRTVWQGLATEA